MRACRIENGDRNHQSVFATIGQSSGSHYWEYIIVECSNDLGIYLGIAKKAGQALTLAELRDTYGLLLPEHKKFYRVPDASRYQLDQNKIGAPGKAGDTYGMLLEFTSSGNAALTIFKNGECMGKMYPDIAEGEYYPCVSLVGGKNTV